eukprot:CAMPEP_0181057894 /NCGR_PEP_ID=MMETSP1070-20121207/20505_1 /TAXON_ID=265543 /ORGANISM="Minutocellus polymorphus, Strain NH13" /LENGTH=543 /DNA_ID=CAMNT_0023137361 /DNA_START=5 /DNA_END=1636 /DNA_ORIENTATION=+
MTSCTEEVDRLQRLFASGELIHPFLEASHFSDVGGGDDGCAHCTSNFADLSAAFALCCGASIPSASPEAEELARDIAGEKLDCRHIILILCDGMGNSVIDEHCSSGTDTSTPSFLRTHNNPARLRAVFPSTTPAALTTLATASWPGSGHGMPGWDLRDKSGCDYPDSPAATHVHLRCLAESIVDVRSGRPAEEVGFGGSDWDNVFVERPWANQIAEQTSPRRRMIYINAYNGDEYQQWGQGKEKKADMKDEVEEEVPTKKRKSSLDGGSDFSSWQMGRPRGPSMEQDVTADEHDEWFDAVKIEETAFDTLGKPEGYDGAISFFRDGAKAAIEHIAQAEADNVSSFVYLYTAHPDKHMHALGVESDEVGRVVRGIEKEIQHIWSSLGTQNNGDGLDCALVVTADHGHVTVKPDEMVQLPANIVACLEYANVGAWGKGRHAYLHCRAGLQQTLRQRWRDAPNGLADTFILLTIEEAADLRLFGPNAVKMEVRPRMGDFVAIAVGRHTLVSPKEASQHKAAQGAHGSLLPEEMHIPFVLCKPESPT